MRSLLSLFVVRGLWLLDLYNMMSLFHLIRCMSLLRGQSQFQ
ncbi:unnamed protein product [Spirodela intermedia]|uniref:Uncharacterized protein n=1 Tax=Spirodela intermedia TaxID=51605 RepID=A0A7I8IDR4_SPIIN|nr:unnamed protein product [Spirodela intermedia]CAA6655534.1 unnamed protein product [Spirodela intermedia]